MTQAEVVNNLTSTSTVLPLSANQGRLLNSAIGGKAASSHKHDDRYYTESEMNTKLNTKVSTGSQGSLYSLELSSPLPYIDFHYNSSSADYTTRIIQQANERLDILGGHLFVDYGCIYTGTGAHLIAADNTRNVYLHGGSVLCRNVESNAYVPIYASSFSQQSSRRFKENIRDMKDEDALKLYDVEVKKFDYKNGDKNLPGCIAEEMLEIYPEICTNLINEETGKEELAGIDYTKLIPYMLKILQIQHNEINLMREEIAKLQFYKSV